MRFSICKISISASICVSRYSRRSMIGKVSRTRCFWSSLMERCAAIVSVKRPASSTLARDDRISAGIFLFSLMYCSNCARMVRRKASVCASACTPAGAAISSGTAAQKNCASCSSTVWVRARCNPSTSTLTVPSGSLSICRIFEIHPTGYRSEDFSSSLAGFFCAVNMMRLPLAIANSSALIDFGRPTNRETTICGNTTMSLSGNSGSNTHFDGRLDVSDIGLCPRWKIGYFLEPMHKMCASIRTCNLRRIFTNPQRLTGAVDDFLVHNNFAGIFHRGQFVHRIEERLFQNRAQPACARFALDGFAHNRFKRLWSYFKRYMLHCEKFMILLDERVFGLNQNFY